MIVIILVIIICIVMILNTYNRFVKLQNNVKNARSGIDVFLNQRFDLIPNLVSCVKGYMKHEQNVLEEITKLRINYNENGKHNISDAKKINNKINEIIAIGENYPELKSSEQFLNLQKSLIKIESQLQAARRIYNIAVTEYNNRVLMVPENIVAIIFGFQEEELFEIEEYRKENIQVDL